jgi:hypothetical protein
MRRASLIYYRHRDNRLFASEERGRFHLPFARLREEFLRHGIELNTPDRNAGRPVLFELHINAQRRAPATPGYAYLYENALVRPRNERPAALAAYRKVFSWNPTLASRLAEADTTRPAVVLLPYPNRLTVNAPVPTFAERLHDCVLVATNKCPAADPRDLYARRVEAIRAFEQGTPPDYFGLYGRGWEFPPGQPGKLGRLLTSLRRRLLPQPATPPFPNWRGLVADKDALLRSAKFAVCYENAADIPGYITEKIFDCLRTGCVPIYWGPQDITRQLPTACFIDARAFASAPDIVTHLLTLGADEHAQMQAAGAEFLRSPAAAVFSEEHFVRTLAAEIAADFPALATP